MNRTTRFKFLPICLLAVAALLLPSLAQAQQLISSPATLSITYANSETITTTISPTSLALTLTPQPVNVTTTYNLSNTRLAVGQFVYIGSTTAALSGSGGNVISPANLFFTGAGGEAGCNQPLMDGGSGYDGLFTGVGLAGGNCGVVNYQLGLNGVYNSTMTGTFQLRINPAAVVPAGISFSGTVFVISIAV